MGFEPSLVHGSTTTMSPFRFWCQKVLPLVYDNSLSYYELLCKVVEYLNETMENVNTIGENTNALYSSYLELVNYVNTYFDNLDVQSQIDNKLDAMAESGELISLIAPYLPFVTPEMYGAVGDGVTDDTLALKNAIESENNIVFLNNKTYLINPQNIKIKKNIDFNGAKFIVDNSGDSNYVFIMESNSSTEVPILPSQFTEYKTVNENLFNKTFALTETYNGKDLTQILECDDQGFFLKSKLYVNVENIETALFVRDRMDTPLTLQNCTITYKNKNNKYNTFLLVGRNNVTLDNFYENYEINNIDTAIIVASNIANFTIKNSFLESANDLDNDYSYGLGVYGCCNLLVDNINGVVNRWGAIGTGGITNYKMLNSNNIRFDCHNLMFGFGVVENCCLNGGNIPGGEYQLSFKNIILNPNDNIYAFLVRNDIPIYNEVQGSCSKSLILLVYLVVTTIMSKVGDSLGI